MNRFKQRKKDILNKKDKSNIGRWDKRVAELCDKINSLDDYYTTSSCSGRIMIIADKDKKEPDLFEWVSHDKANFKDFKKHIPEKGDFKFKQEPPIFHIACKNLNSSISLLKKIRNAGWKRAGIISLGKNKIIEMIGTEKIEFPFIEKGKVLANDKFLKKVLENSNKNLEKGWKNIKQLRNLL